ncbi:hypothetical protein GCK72_007994 [Caenorhabditis remanei]|uniref:Uncharacterized protein n=1 Tax=Caenorhabditis remanei TaxID=31234 RepID=A0A6A5HNW2_CAERE|nr:hypothetical protein GCK72_007994 [Caenorhabditis remanei]KAF1768033.1 hypothetical protein GCK72_007994 [Caenorhabditis remanei]
MTKFAHKRDPRVKLYRETLERREAEQPDLPENDGVLNDMYENEMPPHAYFRCNTTKGGFVYRFHFITSKWVKSVDCKTLGQIEMTFGCQIHKLERKNWILYTIVGRFYQLKRIVDEMEKHTRRASVMKLQIPEALYENPTLISSLPALSQCDLSFQHDKRIMIITGISSLLTPLVDALKNLGRTGSLASFTEEVYTLSRRRALKMGKNVILAETDDLYLVFTRAQLSKVTREGLLKQTDVIVEMVDECSTNVTVRVQGSKENVTEYYHEVNKVFLGKEEYKLVPVPFTTQNWKK